MGESTGIGWTHHTANFWWGCQRVSPGCEHCYAEHLAVVRRKLPVWGPPSTTGRERKKGVWKDVPKWNAAAKADGVRRRMFVSSMADVFEAHPQVAPWRAEALDLLADCDGLDVQLLTKRPENIRAMVPAAWLESWPAHVWVGTTVEDQKRAEQRIPHLLAVPAAVRFLSCEPLLGRVNLKLGRGGDCRRCGNRYCLNGVHAEFPKSRLDWVIVGGESGPGARPCDLAWIRGIVAQCQAAGVSVFVKQLGSKPVTAMRGSWINELQRHGPDIQQPYGRVACWACRTEECKLLWPGVPPHVKRWLPLRDRKGGDMSEWPEDLRVREFPS